MHTVLGWACLAFEGQCSMSCPLYSCAAALGRRASGTVKYTGEDARFIGMSSPRRAVTWVPGSKPPRWGRDRADSPQT
jgi:hypothetical protein